MQRDTRWLSLYILCTGMLMIVLDTTVLNVALPSIQHDFGFESSTLAWVVNAYLIAFAGLLLLSGRLGDLIGSKRIFIAGLTIFTLASLGCGISWNGSVIIVARFVQGIGGAMASAVILAMIVTMFTLPSERARAMGIFSFVASGGGSIGLLLGGAITQSVGWHWAFMVNVPIGIAAIWIGMRLLPDGNGIGWKEGADVVGAVAITLSLMLGVYAVVEIPVVGAGSPQTIVSAVFAVALFIGFLVRQARAAHPLVPLELFASPSFAGSNLIQALVGTACMGFFFLDALFLRNVRHYDAIATGLAFLPITLAIGALSLQWAEVLSTRFGARNVLITGLIVCSGAMAWFAFIPLSGPYLTSTFVPMLLLGIGIGVAFPPLMLLAMADTNESDAGAASGILNTSAEVGAALGLATLATVLATFGYQVTFGVATACIVGGAAVAIFWIRASTTGATETEEAAA